MSPRLRLLPPSCELGLCGRTTSRTNTEKNLAADRTIRAIAFLVVVLVWPDSTGALLLLFYPKIIGICVLAVLLSRVKMREQQLNSNLQSKSLRSGLTGRSKTVGGGRTNVGVSAFAPASLSRGVDQPVVDENASEANLIRSERM